VAPVVTKLAHSWRRTVVAVLGTWALVLFAALEVVGIVGNHGIGSDFAGTVYHPAQALVHGHVPYGDPRLPGPLAGSVYPPSAFVPFFWLGFLGSAGAVAIWIFLMAAAAVGTLAVLGVRDLRCYALWVLTPMMLSTIAIGNATTLVIFLLAVVWRRRDSPWIAAGALVVAIATKLFAAPFVFWLITTRRYRAAALTVVGVPLVLASSWAVVGFAAIDRYGSILSANNHIYAPAGPYLQGLVLQLHESSNVALAAGVVAAGLLLAAAREADDLGGFTLAACAAVILSPVAWIGYMGLLVIPLAVSWPRWSRAWLLLLGTYISWYYFPLPFRSPALSVCTLALLAALVVVVLRGAAAFSRLKAAPA
jgi:glycosyl transferase family 87